jgi:alpha-beta hydrolase superfamily lysophospholipase
VQFFLKKWAVRIAWGMILVLGTLVVGGAVDARRRHPDLKAWHRLVPHDVHADEISETFTLQQWMRREVEVFDEVATLERGMTGDNRTPVNRYFAGSRTHPSRLGQNWNRTFELEPTTLRGGTVLVHGLTDSPYSMRAVAELLRDEGFYTLALRMPGHGTVPGGLTDVDWQDWLAAVRMGTRHARQKIGAERPLLLVGYSNGGALVLKYAAEALERPQDPAPSRLVLISPMIGVTPAARLARWISMLGVVPYFEKARWLDVLPEYNPIKYNSFPANAGLQTALLTAALQKDLAKLSESGDISRLPAVLTFQSAVDATVSTAAVVRGLYDQSAVDATVSTAAVVRGLYDRLPANGSELVLFDMNHQSGIDAFVRATDLSAVDGLFDRASRRYRRTLVTNRSPETTDVVARTIGSEESVAVDLELGLAWPPGVFSLTHVALPFPADDPLYGSDPPEDGSGLFRLGRLNPRGERAVLIAGADTFLRLASNPFFPYIATRVREWATVR